MQAVVDLTRDIHAPPPRDPLVHYAQNLGPAILQNSSIAVQKLWDFIKSQRFIEIMEGPEGLRLMTWWLNDNPKHPIQNTAWWAGRNDFYLHLATIALDSDQTIRIIRNKLGHMNVNWGLRIRESSSGFCVLHVENIQSKVDMVDSMLPSKAHAIIRLFAFIPALLDWSWFLESTRHAPTNTVALAMMHVRYNYRVVYNPTRTEVPFFVKRVRLTPLSRMVSAELAMNPCWDSVSLANVLVREMDGPAEVIYLLMRCNHEESAQLRVYQVEPNVFELEASVWSLLPVEKGVNVSFPTSECLAFYENLLKTAGMSHVIDMPMLLQMKKLEQKETKTTGQQLMNTLYRPRQLKFSNVDQTRVDLPFVRGDKAAGPTRYPIRMPDCARPSVVLTLGQVTTLEFMEERETVSFAELMCHHMPSEVGRNMISMYTPLPLFRVSEANWIAATRIGGGIIADETGTGKTLSMIMRCMQNPNEHNMIVVPDGLVLHWSSEIQKHTTLGVWEDAQYKNMGADGVAPAIKHRKISNKINAQDHSVVVLHRTQCIRSIDWTTLPRLVIVSHSALRSSAFGETFFEAHQFDRLIVDEGHHVKEKTQKLFDLERMGAALTRTQIKERTKLLNQIEKAKELYSQLEKTSADNLVR